MRVFRANGVYSASMSIPLTHDGPQQVVIILDIDEDRPRPGYEDSSDSLRLGLGNSETLFMDRQIAYIGGGSDGGLANAVVVTFDPEPGDVLLADLSIGANYETQSWRIRVLLDGLGTIPLIIEPANAGELIEGEHEDGSFISPISLDIHHIDAELEPETRGIQTVGVTTQFDGETGYLILGSGQLLDKNMTTGETHLLGGVDSWDSRGGRSVIQGCLSGGGLGRHGSSGVERCGLGADGAADHRAA